MSKRYRELVTDVQAVRAVPHHATGRPRGRSGGPASLAGGCVAPAGAPADVAAPTAFTWRDQRYRVRVVLDRWKEDRAWTLDPSRTDWLGEGSAGRTPPVPVGRLVLDQASDVREHWRVEAVGPRGVGVYELCHRGDQWRLERVWD